MLSFSLLWVYKVWLKIVNVVTVFLAYERTSTERNTHTNSIYPQIKPARTVHSFTLYVLTKSTLNVLIPSKSLIEQDIVDLT